MATLVTLTYDNMKRQLKAIFNSSTISTNSESIDVKSEPVFYLIKATDGRYQDSKDNSRDGTSQCPIEIIKHITQRSLLSTERKF